MITALFVMAGGLLSAPLSLAPQAELEAAEVYLPGSAYGVTVTYHLPAGTTEIPAWLLGPSTFAIDGQPLGERVRTGVPVAADSTIQLSLDLAPHFEGLSLERKRSFDLSVGGGDLLGPTISVTVYKPAPEELVFWAAGEDNTAGAVPTEELGNYRVLLQTTAGDMLVEFWPEIAPNHVRNFLDLSYTGFYDGLIFHRVFPGFMIQGGDPLGTGSGQGPHKLTAEFSDTPHVRGVLSMARLGHDNDSATSQFFIMQAENRGLDGGYSAFGRLVLGEATLDAIANAPGRPLSGQGDVRPTVNQTILHAVVVMAADEE